MVEKRRRPRNNFKIPRYDYLIENKNEKIINDANKLETIYIDSIILNQKLFIYYCFYSLRHTNVCITNGSLWSKSIDYPNLKDGKTNYISGNKKVIFKDLEELIIELKNLKMDKVIMLT